MSIVAVVLAGANVMNQNGLLCNTSAKFSCIG